MYKFLIVLFLISWILRGFLTVDLLKANYPENIGLQLTFVDVDKFLKEKGISAEDGYKKVAWFPGYAGNVGRLSLESLTDEINRDVEYVLWPYWNIGLLYTKSNVDKETHNQKAFVEKYATDISYRFPSLMSRYTYYTRLFAWKVLKITWNPEIDSVTDAEYAVLKIKHPEDRISLTYDVLSKDMPKYFYPHSRTFNLKTLPDGYGFPPCYSYHYVRNAYNDEWAEPPVDIGVGSRTAGLYCHSTRFRVAMKGTYRIRVEGLPDDPQELQKVYLVLENFDWDPKTKTATFVLDETRFSIEFGVATVEENIPNLKFHIFYISDVSEI